MSRTWRFGDDVNTDEIIPGRYNLTIDPTELAQHAFCEVRPEFPQQVAPGDVLLGGRNFGCGSSREHAPIALKGTGIRCVVAESFARIFFRNAVNVGLAIMICPDAASIPDDAELSVDFEAGVIRDERTGVEYRAEPMPAFVRAIIAAEGIVPFLREHDLDELL